MKALTLGKLLYRRFFRGDQDAGLYLLRKVGQALVPGYRFQYPQIGWWNDALFSAYLERFGELQAMNGDRHFMCYQLCRMIEHVPGDTAECGVFQGASSYLICLANQGTGKVHHAFDSFAGLSAPGPRDGAYWTPGTLACDLASVQRNLSDFPGVRYHKGWIPERFDEVASARFSFVHVDVDLEQPTRDSVAFFYERLSPGGILLCDDYGFTTCPGATLAIDELLADKPEKMVELSSGGGFFIKGVPVGPSYDARSQHRS